MDLATSPIRVMEPAIVERLRLAFPVKDFQIERVPPVLTMKEFERVTRLTPFIGLAWMGIRPDTASGRVLQAAMRWRLVMIVKASNSLETRFKGDTKDIGLDAMVDVAAALLQGHTFPGIGASALTGAEGVYAEGWADEAIVLANVDFEIRYAFSPAALKLVTPGDFRELGVSWLANDDANVETTQTIQPQENA